MSSITPLSLKAFTHRLAIAAPISPGVDLRLSPSLVGLPPQATMMDLERRERFFITNSFIAHGGMATRMIISELSRIETSLVSTET
jgi:hypothetical protein